MTEEQKSKIVEILFSIYKQVDKLPSIEEKLKKYFAILKNYVDNDVLGFELDL